jgi:hypothetical protein
MLEEWKGLAFYVGKKAERIKRDTRTFVNAKYVVGMLSYDQQSPLVRWSVISLLTKDTKRNTTGPLGFLEIRARSTLSIAVL